MVSIFRFHVPSGNYSKLFLFDQSTKVKIYCDVSLLAVLLPAGEFFVSHFFVVFLLYAIRVVAYDQWNETWTDCVIFRLCFVLYLLILFALLFSSHPLPNSILVAESTFLRPLSVVFFIFLFCFVCRSLSSHILIIIMWMLVIQCLRVIFAKLWY